MRIGRIILGALATIGGLTIVLAIAGVIALSAMLSALPEPEPLPKRFALVISLDGNLRESAQGNPIDRILLEPGKPTLLDLIRAIDTAATDDRVGGVMLDLSGARLGYAQAQELAAAVGRLRGAGKPVHSFVESLDGPRALALFALASTAETIWLQPSGILDIRGVSLEVPFFRDALDEFGITPDFRTRHEYKSTFVSLTEKTLPAGIRDNYKRMVDSLFSQSVSDIAGQRQLPVQAILTLVDQAPLLASEAIDNRLVDRLGYRDEVEDVVAGKNSIVSIAAYLEDLNSSDIDDEAEPPAEIAVVAVVGALVRNGSGGLPGDRIASAREIADTIREVREIGKARALILRVDSPGGSYVASDVLLRELRLTRKAGIPIVVSMGDTAASGGYFIALAGDHVLAQRGTITGSIGVAGGKVAAGRLLTRFGIGGERVSAGANAGMFSPAEPFNLRQSKRLDAMLDFIYADFTRQVGKARRLSPTDLDKVARGRIWSGADAVDAGLVDVLGGYHEATVLARESSGIAPTRGIRLVPYPKPRPTLEMLRDLADESDLLGARDGLTVLARLLVYLQPIAHIIGSTGNWNAASWDAKLLGGPIGFKVR
jgi:protease IV